MVSGTQCIDVPWHDSPLLTIIPQSGPGTESFSVAARPNPGSGGGRTQVRMRWYDSGVLRHNRSGLLIALPETVSGSRHLTERKNRETQDACIVHCPRDCNRRGLFPQCRSQRNGAALEEHFRQSLSGATLVGHFTVGDQKDLREEKYTITKVSKIPGGLWLFQVRIQYGNRDVTLPLPLKVEWAGDTPVITLTDLSIPNLGTYTARVLIYRDQYAGTWSGGDVGGQMFGRLVRDTKP